jgi:hypothetical protein
MALNNRRYLNHFIVVIHGKKATATAVAKNEIIPISRSV